jgi:hypothetical protein
LLDRSPSGEHQRALVINLDWRFGSHRERLAGNSPWSWNRFVNCRRAFARDDVTTRNVDRMMCLLGRSP